MIMLYRKSYEDIKEILIN